MTKHIRYGMVGGSNTAFIGDVHRKALRFDPRAELVAGCFSTHREKNVATAAVYDLAEDRVYDDFKTMAVTEAGRADGIDFVVIATPNVMHYHVAKCFLEAGIDVFCEKPLCFTNEQAAELQKLTEDRGSLFGVAYAYTGYTMSKVMREMISEGKIGRVLAVNAEYAQDWLLDELSPDRSDGMDLAVWRTDPKISGISNCVGDIGTHIESYVSYVTGLKIRRLLATADRFGKELDLNANIIVEYDNGARGAYWCSQVAAGHCNGLVVRIYGDGGSLEWRQESPDVLLYAKKGEAPRLINRGTGCIAERAGGVSRLPSGHPEGLYVAFANLYREFLDAIEAKKSGAPKRPFDYPSVAMGVDGVKFVHAVVESAASDSRWIDID